MITKNDIIEAQKLLDYEHVSKSLTVNKDLIELEQNINLTKDVNQRVEIMQIFFKKTRSILT